MTRFQAMTIPLEFPIISCFGGSAGSPQAGSTSSPLADLMNNATNNSSNSRPRRLYMDNAATSFPKPAAVLEAMSRYALELGASAGRGAYGEAIETGSLILECRRRLKQLFNGERAEHFIF